MSLVLQSGHWRPQKKQRTLSRHVNPGLEIVYVKRGEVIWELEGRPVRAPGGSVFYTWPWQVHAGIDSHLNAYEIYWILVAIDAEVAGESDCSPFPPELGFGAETSARLLRAMHACEDQCLVADSRVGSRIEEAVQVATDHSSFCDEYVNSLVAQVIVLIARSIIAVPSTDRPDHPDERVSRLLKTIVAYPESDWSLDRMTRLCGIGRTGLIARVSAIAGGTPIQFVNRARVHRAQELLRSPKLSVTDVAMACGYSSSQYFARVFRQYTGTSPCDWREAASTDHHPGITVLPAESDGRDTLLAIKADSLPASIITR